MSAAAARRRPRPPSSSHLAAPLASRQREVRPRPRRRRRAVGPHGACRPPFVHQPQRGQHKVEAGPERKVERRDGVAAGLHLGARVAGVVIVGSLGAQRHRVGGGREKGGSAKGVGDSAAAAAQCTLHGHAKWRPRPPTTPPRVAVLWSWRRPPLPRSGDVAMPRRVPRRCGASGRRRLRWPTA